MSNPFSIAFEFVRGLSITLRNMLRPHSTIPHPFVVWQVQDNYRGAPVLVTDQDGRAKCVACCLCEFICPPQAISIKAGELPEDNKVEKYPAEFTIDMNKCIFCGFCEEVCPEQAIFCKKEWAFQGPSRQSLIYNKEALLARGGVHHDIIKKWGKQK